MLFYTTTSGPGVIIGFQTLDRPVRHVAWALGRSRTISADQKNLKRGYSLSRFVFCTAFEDLWLMPPSTLVDMGSGYGFPSSHSQWMGYFASFLLCHFTFRHRFSSTGYPLLDGLFELALYVAITAWSCAVAYSRSVPLYRSLETLDFDLNLSSFQVPSELPHT